MPQPYEYRRRELVEPDWTRLPGWREVTRDQWSSAQWQRANCVKNVKQLRAVLGDLIDERFYLDLSADQERFATMSMLVPPQMINTMVPDRVPDTDAFYADPIRRYMIPVASDRRNRLALASTRDPGFAARARHVGGRGTDPPLPHQGPRRTAVHLSRSTAGTALGWTWSATPPRRSTS